MSAPNPYEGTPYAEPGPFTKFPGEGLPDIKRIITGHNAKGESVVIHEDNGAHQDVMGNGRGVMNIIYSTHENPVEMTDDVDVKYAREHGPGLHERNGSVVRMIDFAPGQESPLHRALSIDYGTVLEGEFELGLDSGEKRILRRGDMIVNRATVHMWKNCSPDKPGRMLFILLDCKPLTINGKKLELDMGELAREFKAEEH
ncbi:hypothetical protein MMC25_005058 [Agyrium rufum]|nr:hypothetical protein [Agyrium rufum]